MLQLLNDDSRRKLNECSCCGLPGCGFVFRIVSFARIIGQTQIILTQKYHTTWNQNVRSSRLKKFAYNQGFFLSKQRS